MRVGEGGGGRVRFCSLLVVVSVSRESSSSAVLASSETHSESILQLGVLTTVVLNSVQESGLMFL